MRHLLVAILSLIAVVAQGQSIEVPRSFNVDRLMCYWVRHNTVHTNELYDVLRDHTLWGQQHDGPPQGIIVRNVSLASFPTLAELTNNVAAADAEYETETTVEQTPARKWGNMTVIEKSRWYTLYLLGKDSGAIPGGWTFVRFLRYVKENVFDTKPWEAEGLP